MTKSKLQALIKPKWADILYPYFQTDAFKKLNSKINKDREITKVFPDKDKIFRIFSETDLSEVRVNIMGVGPYHNTYADKSPAALGRAFAANRVFGMPESLKNVIREVEEDISLAPGFDPSLQHWVDQGVFLLNSALTVSEGKKNSHIEYWKEFTIAVCKALNTKDNIVHILWGNHTQSFKQYFTNPTHKFIESPSPSSFSANNGFFNSKPFSKCNEFLNEPINWLDTKTWLQKTDEKTIKLTQEYHEKIWLAGHNPGILSHKDIKILPYEGQEEE
tara:strand:+ start:201 stop:1028 length:828 start_codon:yes stop_codon:yes gene_type:complete